jgi:isocitrate dehydrogenase (NAD+)
MAQRKETGERMAYTAVMIPGDGIGPEVTSAARRVLSAAGAEITWIERYAGVSALDRGADSVLPADTMEAIREHHVALKGPCTTPIGGGFSSINVALRKQLNLYGAVRPVRSLNGVKTRFEDVDVIVVRENTEGLYSGIENTITEGVITSIKVATELACRRIARFAFEYAVSRKRKKVTVFHKANIMKLSDGLFIRCAKEAHERDFPQIEYEEVIIDAGCMRLVQDPTRFDVILCENLYGDVISDLCAGLVGGLGVTPGANFGDENAIFEAVHGSAPDIAGQNVANPLAMIMSSVMMLNHIGDTHGDDAIKAVGRRIRDAYNACLNDGEKTRDLGGDLGTSEFAEAIIRRLK